jgi:Tfp pilus assembly protein PilZ
MIPLRTTIGARRHDRIRTRLKVRFGVGNTDREELCQSISEGGLYIGTNDVYKVGTRLTVKVELPEGTVCHRGEVVWAIKVPEHLRDSMVCGMGISFIDPDPEWPAFFRRWKASMGAPIESTADFD